MNEKDIFFKNDFIPICFLCFVFVIACTFLYGKSCGRNESKYNNVGGTLQQATQEVETAGGIVAEIKEENRDVGYAVDRANETLGQVRERTVICKEQISEARNLIDEIIELNRSAQRGLEDFTEPNK